MPSAAQTDDPWRPLTRKGLVAVLRRIYLAQLDGVIEFRDVDEPPLYFERGALFIGGSPPPPTDEEPEESGGMLGGIDPGHLRLLEILVDRLRFGEEAKFALYPGHVDVPVDAIGPIPTFALAVQVATRDVSIGELVRFLGGKEARLVLDHRVALERLPPLRPEVQQLVSRLVDPHTLAELERLQGTGCVRPVAALTALGFVIREGERDRKEESEAEDGRVPANFLDRFRERIGAGLVSRPLKLDPEVHRERVATLVAEVGSMTHYELLDISVSASPELVAGAFEKVAREVHPWHAEALALPGGATIMEALFERATEASLVVSDPARKVQYDETVGVHPELEELSEEKMIEVRARMAQESYERAVSHLKMEDFHYALEHVKDAVRLDPRPEYYAFKGLVQGKNPKWLGEAIANLQLAIDERPEELSYRLQLAEILEEAGRSGPAEAQYRTVLEKAPGHQEASIALGRLTLANTKEKKGPLGWLSRWLEKE
jgi:chromosome segregation and condensation protein ScpB